MAAGKTYDQIFTTTLTAAVASLTISSISGAFTDLVLIVVGQSSINDQYVRVQVGNGSVDTGNNYSWTNVLGYSGGAISQRDSNVSYLQMAAGSSDTVPGTYIGHFMNYANTTTYKTLLSRGNNVGTVSVTDAHVSLWRSSAAINIITVKSTANFSVGTTFTLYGIVAA